MTDWKPLANAVIEPDKEYLVTGRSGYRGPHPKFVINAYFCPSKMDWMDATNTRLSGYGWTPTHYRDMLDLP